MDNVKGSFGRRRHSAKPLRRRRTSLRQCNDSKSRKRFQFYFWSEHLLPGNGHRCQKTAISSASLVWTSNKDGQIGTGAALHENTYERKPRDHRVRSRIPPETIQAPHHSHCGAHLRIRHKCMVNSITYALQGTTLVYTAKVVNEFGAPVAGATVETDIMEWVFTGQLWISTAVSNSQGNAVFQLPNVDLGCYVTAVRSVTAAGLTWVGGTPSNNFCYGF